MNSEKKMKFQTQQLLFKPMSNSGNIITEIMQISPIKWSTGLTIAIFNNSALILKYKSKHFSFPFGINFAK